MKDTSKQKYTVAQRKVRGLLIWSTGIILVFGLIVYALLAFLFEKFGIINADNSFGILIPEILLLILTSTIIGLVLSIRVNKSFFDPIYRLLAGMERLGQGKLSTRIDLSKHKGLEEIESAFNNMAEDLGKVEILRSDFINNFSHEFKTPIAAIQGLVGIMKNKELSPEKKQEYLTIIEEETKRLSLMTTNVLNISKLENQVGLTKKDNFNLSEQIRVSLLMFEKTWTEKEINLSLDFDEYYITADEDLLKQVWINLLDNALKFVNQGGEISISITENNKFLSVAIANTGKKIPAEHLDKIFNKFYQVERSAANNGNGIGLSIVQKIVELHGGTVSVSSDDKSTAFTVRLPL